MITGISLREFLEKKLVEVHKGNDVYWADPTFFESTGSDNPQDWRDYAARERKAGKDVSTFPLYRKRKKDGLFYQINLFRFRDSKRKGVMIPFFGPDLQDTLNSQSTTRRHGNKNSNYNILSLMYMGNRHKPLVCSDKECDTKLIGRELKGYKLGSRGDFHHLTVLHNKSFWKGKVDPSKRLENVNLHNGASEASMDCLLDFMGCVPFCKVCHSDWHQMFSKRARDTKHSDIRDYDVCERAWFLRSERNYNRFVLIMQKRHGYGDFPSYNDWMEKMHLPKNLVLKWS